MPWQSAGRLPRSPLFSEYRCPLSSQKYERISGRYNFSGLPSISLPIGLEDNFPFDANLTGRAFDEANLLNIAYSIEQRTNLKDLVVEKVVD